MDDDLFAAMYLDDNSEQKPVEMQPTGFSRTRTIHVGAIKYEVPTIEYVTRLEFVINYQAKMMAALKQELITLRHSLNSTKNFANRQSDRLHEMQNALDNKLDLREGI